MKALVTGAGGFIGSHLVTELTEKGHSVSGLFLPGEDAAKTEATGVKILRGDITDPSSLSEMTEDIETVFHLATRTTDWGSKKAFEKIMLNGTENVLEASKGKIKRFIYFSSIAALGFGRDLDGFTEDETRIFCGIPYCDTKIKAEDMVKAFCNSNGIDFTIIRPANVIGPGSVWVKDILDAFSKSVVPLINKGNASGAFIYIDNLINGTILAAESDTAKGRTYHFRDDYTVTWGEYFRRLGNLVGKKPSVSIPFSVAWHLGYILETVLTPLNVRPPMTRLAASVLGKNKDVDTTKAKTDLGWQTSIPFDEAMTKIEDWVNSVYIPEIMNR